MWRSSLSLSSLYDMGITQRSPVPLWSMVFIFQILEIPRSGLQTSHVPPAEDNRRQTLQVERTT